MKRFRPLLLSCLLTAVLACLVAWRQHDRITTLRAKIATGAAVSSPVAPPAAEVKPAPSPVRATDFASVMSQTKSRSMLRTGQELIRYYQSCPIGELRAALEELARGARLSSLEMAGAFVIAMSALSERDGPGAVEFLKMLKGDVLLPAAVIVLNDWMLRDRKAAIAWFQGMADQKQKGQILTAAAIFFGSSNPQLVEDLKNGVSDEGMLEKAASEAVQNLALTDPETALARLDEVPELDARARTRQRALSVLALKEPEKALEMILAGLDKQETTIGNAAQAFRSFLAKDSRAALKWLGAQDLSVTTRLFEADPSLAREAARHQ